MPVFIKNETFLKNNYRPVSILPSVSKFYERCIYDQTNDYFHPQHCLLVSVEKCREILDKLGYAGILLTDLAKALD